MRFGITKYAAATLLLAVAPAFGQTWGPGRQGPSLAELVAIDKTGEPGWPWGGEDVAGDGLAEFKPPERAIDIRTAYAMADNARFWARVYVSDTNGPGGNVTAYVFIDNDRNPSTGGSAAATDIDARFVADASSGGYEYVLAARGNGSISNVWAWQAGGFQTVNVPPAQIGGESGSHLDPIRVGDDAHGYIQLSVTLAQVGVTPACDVNLYFRTTNETAALGAGDLEVGTVGPCVPADSNNDGIPDLSVPPGSCSSDAQCPNGGRCVSGKCVLTPPCALDTDCPSGHRCSEGRCLLVPSGTCSEGADCATRYCAGGQCANCGSDDSCGAGRRCGPDGRCIASTGSAGSAGLSLGPEDEIQGGACACRAAQAPWLPARHLGLMVALGLALVVRRRTRARRR